MNVETNVPKTIWLPGSRRKLRSRRGPNCCDARVSATIVIENVTPATVIIDPAIVESTARAPSAFHPGQPIQERGGHGCIQFDHGHGKQGRRQSHRRGHGPIRVAQVVPGGAQPDHSLLLLLRWSEN